MPRFVLIIVVALFIGALGGVAVRLLSPPCVVITWETASEVDTSGFFLYRSASPAGPFSLLSENPILATGDPLVGASYRYEDRRVAWGEKYFYQLEEMDVDGSRLRFPGVIEGWAGLGWWWALAIGASLAALVAVLFWKMSPGSGRGKQVDAHRYE
jgi:hypothetical protein